MVQPISPPNPGRRKFLSYATSFLGLIGAAFVAVPFLSAFKPSARAEAAGAPVQVDISSISSGEMMVVEWRGKPVFIKRRTQEEIAEAQSVSLDDLPHPEKDQDRVKNPEWLVMLGICTHLGCVPLSDKGEYNGWFCPCHGSHYDTSGRIRKGPAPTNMEIPKYAFVDDNTIKIG